MVSSTKWDAIGLIAKSDDTDSWGGTKIVLEAGKATYQGKLVDSLNVRAPKQKTGAKARPRRIRRRHPILTLKPGRVL